MPGLFDGWFRHRPTVEDRVWIDANACGAGLRSQVTQALRRRAAVLLLVRTRTDRENLARDLAAHAPLVGDDRFANDALQRHLRTPGALGLACVDDLRSTATATPPTATPASLQVHVSGRSARRSEDLELTELLGRWAPAVIAFHHALDDALLRSHADVLQPLVRKLGMRPDEPVISPFLTRAIERAQQP